MGNRIEKGLRKGGLFIGGGIAALAIACGGGKGTEPKVQKGDTPTLPAATETLKSSPTPPTTESPTIPTQEVKQEVPCQILPTEYCSAGKLVDWKDPTNGTTYKFVVFNLPKGTPILAPFKGDFYPNPTGENSPVKAPAFGLIDPSGNYKGVFVGNGDISFINNNQQQHPVNKGDTIASVQNTGISIFGGNFALTFTASGGSDEQMLNKLLGK